VRCHLKDIPLLVLITSLLDTRMNEGVGIPYLDKEQIWEAKKAEMVYIELVDEDVETLMH
jgi:hypothetical protein